MSLAGATEQIPALIRSYEALRRAVIDGVVGRRLDHGVMLGQGMWAWIELTGSEASRPPQDSCSEPWPAPGTEKHPPASRSELVSVWTDLLLGFLPLREVT